MAKGKFEYWLTPEGLSKIGAWARDGLTEEQISHNMGISRSTLSEWKLRFSDFADSLKKDKEVADIQVENSLFKRAIGYEYTETTRELKQNPETGKLEMMVTKQVNKQVIPDTTAQIFWLKNRKPSKWRDKPEYEDKTAIDKLDEIIKGLKDNANNPK